MRRPVAETEQQDQTERVLGEQMKNTIEVQPLLTRRDVCRMLQISLPTVLRFEKDGRLHALRVGRSVRYRKADVDEFVSTSQTCQ